MGKPIPGKFYYDEGPHTLRKCVISQVGLHELRFGSRFVVFKHSADVKFDRLANISQRF